MKVLIVTVVYNPDYETVIDNMKVDTYPHFIIDNSESETYWLKEYCNNKGFKYQWLGGNLGIAKAYNIGAEHAIECSFDYIVTMDQDTVLTADILVRMSDWIKQYEDKERVAIFSPSHSNNLERNNVRLEVTNSINSVSSGNFVNLDVWRRIKGFDEDLFIDMVDIDYYAKSIVNGYKVLTIHNITLLHSVGIKSCTKWIGRYGFDVYNHNKVRKYYQARNFPYVYKKYCKLIPDIVFVKKMILKMPIVIILFEDNKFMKLYFFIRGYIDYRLGRFGKINF